MLLCFFVLLRCSVVWVWCCVVLLVSVDLSLRVPSLINPSLRVSSSVHSFAALCFFCCFCVLSVCCYPIGHIHMQACMHSICTQSARRFFAASSACIRNRTLDSKVAWLVSRQANFKVLLFASDSQVAYDFGLPKKDDRNSKWTRMWCFGVNASSGSMSAMWFWYRSKHSCVLLVSVDPSLRVSSSVHSFAALCCYVVSVCLAALFTCLTPVFVVVFVWYSQLLPGSRLHDSATAVPDLDKANQGRTSSMEPPACSTQTIGIFAKQLYEEQEHGEGLCTFSLAFRLSPRPNHLDCEVVQPGKDSRWIRPPLLSIPIHESIPQQ